MKKDFKVSIIVPVYNVEKYLSDCVDSILNQSYKNIEIILVNDGSTDNSPSICDEYSRKDDRVKVIHKKNEGVSVARNSGIKAASGEYIAFVDSDDLVDKSIYTNMIETIDNKNTDLVMCSFKRIFNNGDMELSDEPLKEGYYNKDLIFEELILPMVGNSFSNMSSPLIMGAIWRCLYKKEIIEKYDITFPKIKIAEDMLFHLYYLAACESVYVTKEPLYYYRYNNLSATKNYISNLWDTLMYQLKLVEEALMKFGIYNEKSKERVHVNTLYFISWCFSNECNPKNPKVYKDAIKEMKKISKNDRYKEVFTWKNIMHASFKERCVFICIKLRLYRILYLYENKTMKNMG